jgi:hypothetical protein
MEKFGFNLPTTSPFLLSLQAEPPSVNKTSEIYRQALVKALMGQRCKGRPVALWRAHLKPIIATLYEINPRARPSEVAHIFIANWEELTGMPNRGRPDFRTFCNFISNVRGGGSGRRLGRVR